MLSTVKTYPVQTTECFFLNGRLIGEQPCYVTFKPNNIPWTLYFYCGDCGEVWGKRVPLASPTSHHYYHSRPCVLHGGVNDMLLPFEWDQLDLLSENVLAGLILAIPEEKIRAK